MVLSDSDVLLQGIFAQKSIHWCKRVTDFHEELFPNEPLQTKMDLHNNAIGIQFLKACYLVCTASFRDFIFINGLIEKTRHAVFISSTDEDAGEQLMYIQL